jgi:heterodisulfide reductase subunit A-like polyferredoxin
MRVELLTAPVEVLRDDRRLRGVRCVRMQLGEPDASGRRRPVPIPGSEFDIEADALIAAVAQAPEISLLAPDHGLQVAREGWFQVDSVTLATNVPSIFAGGDAAQGPGMLIDAIAAGRRGALSIHRHLRGLPMISAREEQPLPVGKWTDAEIEAKLARGEIKRGARPRIAMEPVEARIADFREVELALTEEQAVAEAERCLACGLCAECYQCVKACGVNAIVHEMVEREEQIQVGAVILAPGYEVYRAESSEEFGFGRFPNVVTSLQFERLLSASGPTAGHVQRPSDGKPARKIAFLQCIGSRDQSHDYCSAVCCMYAAKEAMVAKEHNRDADVHIFMMDARAFSKGYAEYYQRARERYGVKYSRCRVSAIKENPANGNLIVRYADNEPISQLANEPNPQSAIRNPQLVEEEFDLVVLSVGMEMSQKVRDLGGKLGVQLDDYGFCRTIPFRPLETSRAGIFAAGPFLEPKDIPETVMDASGAAANAEVLLAQVRGALARRKEYPPERNVTSEPARVGVFVCHCGSNIAGYLDVKAVAEYARTLPNVVHSETNLYTCSQDSIARITQVVKEQNLNRVVVASCTPRTHEPLFQDSIRAAGLNPYLFEMANIRDQCSWVHSHDWDVATHKARDLIRMSVARVSQLEPLFKFEVSLEHSALVIGGGIAGMNAALNLAEQGFPVHLVEKSAHLGGGWQSKADGRRQTAENDWGAYARDLIAHVCAHPRITVHRETKVAETSGFVGNFASRLKRADGAEQTVRHGVVIVATGAQEWRGDAYGLGKDARVVTQSQFAERLAEYEIPNPKSQVPNSVVFVQCVGPAEKYCGRLCCSESLENALRLKELNPNARVTILTKDIRTYGFRERLYQEARKRGVVIIRYDDAHLPQVNSPNLPNMPNVPNEAVAVRVWEPMLREEITLQADLVVVAAPLTPHEDSRELANILKVPVDTDGWFLEAHVKLRPVDFATEGMFVAGAAHYPKFPNEAIAQAQAAAARAATILSKDKLCAGGIVAQVDAEKCTGCLTCVRICPYHVPRIDPAKTAIGGIYGAAYVEAAACQGCGICAAECPGKAIQLLHFKDGQVIAKIEALFEERELVAA